MRFYGKGGRFHCKKANTVNLRFNGSQGTNPFYPLLPKSVVAIWSYFHKKHEKSREKASVIAIVIQAIEIERQGQIGRNRAVGTD